MAVGNESKPVSELCQQIGDFLSDRTRDTRKALLAIAGVRLIIDIGNYIPKVVREWLGDAPLILIDRVFLILISYFLVSFLVYAVADVRIWFEVSSKSTANASGGTGRSPIHSILNLSLEVLTPFLISTFALATMMIVAILR